MLQSLQNIPIITDQNYLLKLQSFQKRTQQQSIIHSQATNPQQYSHLLQQLQAHRKNLKAIQYYVKSVKKRALKSLQNNVQINEYLRIVEKYFIFWKLRTLSTKVQNKIIKNRVFRQLSKNKDKIMKRNLINVMVMAADNCYERCIKAKVFGEWKFFQQSEKKSRKIIRIRTKKQFQSMMSGWSMRKQSKLTIKLAKSIWDQKIVKRFFNEWVIWVKTGKIEKIKFSHQSITFMPALKTYVKYQQSVYKMYYEKFLLKRSYQKLKINRLNGRFDRHYRIKILKKYLNAWISVGSTLFYQKQKQVQNEGIVVEYLARKAKVLVRYYLERWKKYSDDRIQDRKKNDIAKQYGEMKQKQYLQRKYFNALIYNKKYAKAERFNASKLKCRVMNSLKSQIIKSSQKLERVYEFVDRRERKKYFYAIIAFNRQEKRKVELHLMAKFWNLFTLEIVRQFVSFNKKADDYHEEVLKYKAFFTLKDALIIKSKINKTIIFIHGNLNLRRWRRYHKVKQFIETKKYITLTQVFRQLKLLRLNKIWSQAKIEVPPLAHIGLFSNSNETTPQSSIHLDRINSQSPSKMFSLEYSISAYNSNNQY